MHVPPGHVARFQTAKRHHLPLQFSPSGSYFGKTRIIPSVCFDQGRGMHILGVFDSDDFQLVWTNNSTEFVKEQPDGSLFCYPYQHVNCFLVREENSIFPEPRIDEAFQRLIQFHRCVNPTAHSDSFNIGLRKRNCANHRSGSQFITGIFIIAVLARGNGHGLKVLRQLFWQKTSRRRVILAVCRIPAINTHWCVE